MRRLYNIPVRITKIPTLKTSKVTLESIKKQSRIPRRDGMGKFLKFRGTLNFLRMLCLLNRITARLTAMNAVKVEKVAKDAVETISPKNRKRIEKVATRIIAVHGVL